MFARPAPPISLVSKCLLSPTTFLDPGGHATLDPCGGWGDGRGLPGNRLGPGKVGRQQPEAC